MVQRKGRSGRSGDEPAKYGVDRSAGNVSDALAGGNRPGSLALPADLGRSLRYLDDAQLDRLLEAAGAEAAQARQAGRQDGWRGNARKARSGDARAGTADPGGARSRPQAGGDRPGVSPVARAGGRRGGRREAASPVTGFLECTEAGPCAAAHA